MYCVILVRPKQDGSFLWSHDLSRDLQKVDTKWTRFPTGLDGLAFAFRLPTSFYWIRYIICLVYILTHRWGSVIWDKTSTLRIQTHILITNVWNSLTLFHDQTHIEFLIYRYFRCKIHDIIEINRFSQFCAKMGVLTHLWTKRPTFGTKRPPPLYCPVTVINHDDVIKLKHFPRYWPFVRGIHRWPVNSPHKGQWRGALMFSFICARIYGWVNNCEAGDSRRHRAYYDVIAIFKAELSLITTRIILILILVIC